jgi:hypothetical protein
VDDDVPNRAWRNQRGRRPFNSSLQQRVRSASTSSDQTNQSFSNFRRGNNNYRGNNRTPRDVSNPRERRPMGFRALANLLEKDSEGLILELSNSKRGIGEFIKNDLTDDGVVLFVKVLKKVSDSSFVESKYKVLQTYLDETFVEKLIQYILFLPMQNETRQKKNHHFWQDTDDFWNNLVGICKDICDSLPTFGRKILPDILKSLIVCFPSFQSVHNRHISDGIRENVDKLNEAVQALVKLHEESEKREQKPSNEIEEGEPPDDFREISVYPSALELLSTNQCFLRRNVVEGPYKDVDHYLDVQFRLLREDFVGPLRTGITSYQSRDHLRDKKRIENVKIHKKVRFLNPETVSEQYCLRLRFDFAQKKKQSFKYENSRRFMFGSLLCFTKDNFRSIIFGKVSERKIEDLEKGELIVGFDKNVVVAYNADYQMVECSVYFEPYFHVLNALKNMSVDSFPMEKYIIHVDSSVQPPEYLTIPEREYLIRGMRFLPLTNWPNTNFYNLNESQLQAFKAALTQEFCIIQGPPGTGKTYLGLKIAKTLIENHNIWYKKTPMLVICYTNHALDQFLEGLIAFTERILRVGGQSKNENLKRFNLRSRNNRFRISPAVLQMREKIQGILGKIRTITEDLRQINFYNSVRNFDVFEEIDPDFKRMWFYRANRKEILDWLFQENLPKTDDDNIRQIQEQFGNLNVVANTKEVDGHDNDGDNESDDEDSIDEENEDLNNQLDDIFEEVSLMTVPRSIPLITLTSMEHEIAQLDDFVTQISAKENPNTEDLLQEEKSRFNLFELTIRRDLLKLRLMEGKQRSEMNEMKRKAPKLSDTVNPHQMTPEARWNLYFYWLDLYKQEQVKKLDILNKEFRKSFKIYEELRDVENANLMKDALVIGMTTTGAARLRSSLQALKSPVVIVEEAAEVLEAHIITSLTEHCKHLILIGDHQQLKPSTANFSVERFYKLGISLFERMVINKIQLYTLNVQHRMKPEISKLISPTIYPALQDHPSVTKRSPITGIDKCLFFVDHAHEEECCEGTSKKNYHEVGFLIYFARHLILNGYKPEKITILAAYLGQMFELQKERKKHQHILKDVRIAVLDNYQGEECDIILLSLVRSNKENKIGFLSIENRVCVALSRARDGFYVMGNMTQLCAASELWRKIRRTLEEQNAIGPELAVRCQVHTSTVTYVKARDDFLNIAEGGCDQKCEAALVCGHRCTSLCHVLNRDHLGYRCRETCNKRLCDADARHVCPKMCFEECGPCTYLVQRELSCGHVIKLECHIDPDAYNCTVLVPTMLPCGHTCDKPCHRDAETYRCPHPCEIKVEPCGHACEMKCHVRRDPDHLEYKCRKRCARYRKGCVMKKQEHICRKYCYEECEECNIRVRKKRTICPHLYDVPCFSDVDEIDCEKPCTKILLCGHKCKSKCNEPCGKCEVKVDKVNSICGHTIKVKCCETPDRKLCNKKCPLLLPCGHPCTKKCNEPCTTNCEVMVECTIGAPCGHIVTRIKCSLQNSNFPNDKQVLLQFCNEPCRNQLKCGHSCSGSCGECSQGRVHKRCSEKCGFPLVCNHPCEFPCREACKPCTRVCPVRCKHTSCGKRCGDVCTPCKEECTRKCDHQTCTNYCGDICSVPPCEENCKKTLKCGHQCIGFCGDPCPPKCLICDKEELTEVFFGSEDEDARYIVLNDCGHIFESTGMEQWLHRDEEEIGFKLCPKCKTAIKTTQRYSDCIKQALADVAFVKTNVHGTKKENDDKRVHLEQKLALLLHTSKIRLGSFCQTLEKTLVVLENRLKVTRKGKFQPINKHELSAVESKLQIIEHIENICSKKKTTAVLEDGPPADICLPQVEFIMQIVNRDLDCITEQEIDDVDFELSRLSRIMEFNQIKASSSFRFRLTDSKIKLIVTRIEGILFDLKKFSEECEKSVVQLLKELSKLVASAIGISEMEKREIVKAMGFKQGHWFKCRNGHPYVIADCGGAMVESVCNECGERIGGANHSLRADNAVATEMDGARYGAWSEQANMGNYVLN